MWVFQQSYMSKYCPFLTTFDHDQYDYNLVEWVIKDDLAELDR